MTKKRGPLTVAELRSGTPKKKASTKAKKSATKTTLKKKTTKASSAAALAKKGAVKKASKTKTATTSAATSFKTGENRKAYDFVNRGYQSDKGEGVTYTSRLSQIAAQYGFNEEEVKQWVDETICSRIQIPQSLATTALTQIDLGMRIINSAPVPESLQKQATKSAKELSQWLKNKTKSR